MSNGIVPKIKMDEAMLNHVNKQGDSNGVSFLTDGWLSQKTLMNDDMLLLKYKDFERILIFDRKEIEDEENSYEEMFDSEDEEKD